MTSPAVPNTPFPSRCTPEGPDIPSPFRRGGPRRSSGSVTRGTLLAMVGLATWGCGDRDAASAPLRVGTEARFAERELVGLSPERRRDLGTLTGFGLAVARDELARLGEPRMDRLERELLVEALVDAETLRRGGVGDDVLRARYQTSPAWQLEVRHLVLLAERTAPEATRTAARERAAEALARARAGEDFPSLASEVSEEPGAGPRGGLLRPARRGDWVPEFWAAAANLAPGEISGVVETSYGYHVIRLESREMVPFADMREEVAREVAGMLGRFERDAARSALDEEVGGSIEVPAEAPGLARDPDTPPATLLARWPGGGLRADAYRRWAAGREGAERVDPGADDAVVAGAIARAARDAVLVERALEAGMRLPEAEGEALRRAWMAQAALWGQALGFRVGSSVDAVREQARSALGATGQDQLIARDEVLRVAPLVDALHPVRLTVAQ